MPAPAGFTGPPFMGRNGLQLARSARPRVFCIILFDKRFALGLRNLLPKVEAGFLRTLRTNAHPGNAAVEKIQVYAHLKNVFMTNKHRNVLITSIALSCSG